MGGRRFELRFLRPRRRVIPGYTTLPFLKREAVEEVNNMVKNSFAASPFMPRAGVEPASSCLLPDWSASMRPTDSSVRRQAPLSARLTGQVQRRDSNSFRQIHSLECFHYTTLDMSHSRELNPEPSRYRRGALPICACKIFLRLVSSKATGSERIEHL